MSRKYASISHEEKDKEKKQIKNKLLLEKAFDKISIHKQNTR